MSSRGAKPSHPDRLTLGELARLNVHLRGDAPALACEGRTTSFREFDDHTAQVANGLAAAGVKKGDRIAYLGKNSDYYFEILFGAAKVGAVLTPINWRMAPPEIAYILTDSGAKILFVDGDLITNAPSIASNLKTVITRGEGSANNPSFATWRNAQPPTRPAIEVTSEDIALQLYTSGTTGTPKGAMLRHSGLLGVIPRPEMGLGAWANWTNKDVMLVVMPTFHIAGTGGGLWALNFGAKAHIMREFDPDLVLDFIEAERPSKLFLVPAAIQILLRHPRARQTNYSSLKYILYGASPIPLALLREAMETFECEFVQAYGMTETSGTIVFLQPEDHDPAGNERMRSAGRPLPGVELAIVNKAGQRRAAGEVGEIVTRSVGNMAGYWKLKDATAETLDAEGWLHTGDAGYIDADGYLYIVDRIKDMIISGAENVYPAEVEKAILAHRDIADVAVIGVPDEKWGEAVKAIAVLKPGASASEQDIKDWARQHIAAYKAPKTVEFVDALPRNAAGKVLRRALREPFWAGRERRIN